MSSSKSKSWIDFRDLRERLSFESVLAHYRIDLDPHGGRAQRSAVCPFHDSGGRKTRSLSLNCELKVFQCHSCKVKGSVLDFICLAEGKDPLVGSEFRESVLKVANLLLDGEAASGMPSRVREDDSCSSGKAEEVEMINAPLDFELKTDPKHSCFSDQGIAAKTVEEFDLGYASRGSLKGRIAIPLRDLTGNIIGYAGKRLNDGDSGESMKYPESRREREGMTFSFDLLQILYGAHRLHIGERLSSIVLCQQVEDVWRFFQDGVGTAVAALGEELSEAQAEQIVALLKPDNGCVWIVPPSTESGSRFARSALERLVNRSFCQWVILPEGESPADCSWKAILSRK